MGSRRNDTYVEMVNLQSASGAAKHLSLHPLGLNTGLLPATDDFEAVGNNPVKRLFSVNYCIRTLRQSVLQLTLNLMTGRPLKILCVGSRLDAGVTGTLRGSEEQ